MSNGRTFGLHGLSVLVLLTLLLVSPPLSTGVLIGLWLMVATFIPVFLSGAGLEWNSIVVGSVSVIAGSSALWKSRG